MPGLHRPHRNRPWTVAVWWFALAAGLMTICLTLGAEDTPPVAQVAPLGMPVAPTPTASRADADPLVDPVVLPAPSSPPLGSEADREHPRTELTSEEVEAADDRTDDGANAFLSDEQAPAPAPSDTDSDESTATPAPGVRHEPSADAGPASLSIPTIGVTSVLNPLGLNSDGTLEVPARGPHYDEAAWFHGSPAPGEVGPAVLLGHVNGTGGTPSVFYNLADLGAGDLVTVTAGDGETSTFEVYRTDRYPKDQFPTMSVYGDTVGPELRLITCGGLWDSTTGHYRDNTVVYARVVTS